MLDNLEEQTSIDEISDIAVTSEPLQVGPFAAAENVSGVLSHTAEEFDGLFAAGLIFKSARRKRQVLKQSRVQKQRAS